MAAARPREPVEDEKAKVPGALALAAAFAIAIGLGAGAYPALRASRLTPVDAIRALYGSRIPHYRGKTAMSQQERKPAWWDTERTGRVHAHAHASRSKTLAAPPRLTRGAGA